MPRRHIVFDDREAEQIEDEASRLGMSFSEFVRAGARMLLVLSRQERGAEPERSAKDIARELRKGHPKK